MNHLHILKQAHGRAAENELYDFLRRANVESAEQQEETRNAVIQLRIDNAAWRAAEQREMGAERRNYIIPV